MGIIMARRCPKCGKTYTSEFAICPFCNPGWSLTANGLSLVAKLLGGKK